MYTNTVLAMTGALVAAVAAVPMAEMHHHHHNKRDYVWVTKTEEAVVTVPVTKTVWVQPGETAPTQYSAPDVSPAGYHHGHSAPAYAPESSAAESTSSSAYVAPISSSSSVYVAPTSSSSSVYVAPTPSSSSVYVAPTPSTSSVYVAPAPSSTYVAPTTSTSVYVAPTPSSTYVAPTTYAAPTTSSAAAPAYTSAASSGSGSGISSGSFASGTEYTGDLTWYEVGLGACGWTNTSSQPIVAISHVIFDSYSTGNSNTNPLCGKHVTITGKDGSSHDAQIVDRCVGCEASDLDLSEDFFNTVTENGDGRVSGMSWTCA